ncbi:MAG: nitrogen regulatory protein [Chlamydiota bacterium]
MDLTVKDVTELLNVSETTLRRWVSEGKIPYYRLHQQYRFSRSEVEDWMLNLKQEGQFVRLSDGEMIKDKLGTRQFGLYRAIHKGGVYSDVPGNTKEAVIRAAVERIAQDVHFDADVITDLLLDRERLMPTALSNGIAVPHTRDFLLPESFDVVAVVFPKKPIEYGALDHLPVHTLFFLFACDDKRHLHLLAKLAHFSSHPSNLQLLASHPSKAAFLEHVKSWEAKLAR